MDVDVFLWQHVSRPCVLGEGKRRGRQRENTLFLFFFPPSSSGLECFAVQCFVAAIKCAELFSQLP